jgi:protein phosphatase
LIVQLKKEPDEESTQLHEKPRTLNVYKKHDCTISPVLAEKFSQFEGTLVEAMKREGVQVDWDAYAKLVAGADAAKSKSDGNAAFRARCVSLLLLAEAIHKSRHKQESFRPSFRPPTAD